MARAKKKTYRSLNFKASPKKKHFQTRELLLTLGNGDVLKIEKIENSGKRREVSEAEFAQLAGDGTTDLGAALEHAYTIGFADALEEELKGEEVGPEENEEETMRRFVRRRAAGLRRLQVRARRLIVGYALSGRHMQREKGAKRSAVPS
jgi:hypothetical protein